MADVSLVDPALVWGLVVRGVAVLYAVAHLSLMPQLLAMCGARSVTSVAERLAATKRAFPGVRRFVDAPTLLWLGASDPMLRAWNILGLAGALCGIYGGPVGAVGLFVAWLTYLSLADAAGLTFPWDVLLLECGVLVWFTPPTLELPALACAHAPSALVAFAFHLLVARLMLGFAKVKFIGTKPTDALYLQSFFVWLPVPNPLGWLLHHAPAWFHRFSLRFMFVAEVFAPILLLVPGWPRLIGAALLVALMVGIHGTGNWGFFNVGYALLCIAALDTSTSAARIFSEERAPHELALYAYLAIAVIQLLAFNTWVSRVWSYWPIVDAVQQRAPWTRALFGFFRFVSNARLVNGYGVFPANSWPPLRLTPVFEGSDDGVTWQRYPWRFLPTGARDRPPIVAPHHPRIDQIMTYIAGGLNDTSLLSGLLGAALPVITYTRTNVMERIAQRILQGDARALDLFASDPFGGRAPKHARVSAVALTATTIAHVRATGEWWRVTRVGSLVPAFTSTPEILQHVQPVPELFHADALVWKRRAPGLRAVLEAFRAKRDLRAAIAAGAPELADHVDTMWRDWLPRVRACVDANEPGFAIERELALETRVACERLFERAVWIVRDALEPHRLHGVEPRVPRMPNLRYHLAVSLVVLSCSDLNELVRALADPTSLVDRVARATKERTLALVAAMRPRHVEATTHAFRWVLGNELTAPGAGRAPSILEYFDLIAARTPRDEEWRPRATQSADGAWRVDLP